MPGYKAELPEGVTLPAGHNIDVSHPSYKQLESIATEEKWSQKSFSRILGVEAGRVSAEAAARAAAPPAAPAPAEKPDFSKMSTADKFAYALNNPRRG